MKHPMTLMANSMATSFWRFAVNGSKSELSQLMMDCVKREHTRTTAEPGLVHAANSAVDYLGVSRPDVDRPIDTLPSGLPEIVPKLKAQSKTLLYTSLKHKDNGCLNTTPKEAAEGVGADCLGAAGRMKFLWGRVVWDYVAFDPPACDNICPRTQGVLYKGARLCQLCKQHHCCEPLESL